MVTNYNMGKYHVGYRYIMHALIYMVFLVGCIYFDFVDGIYMTYMCKITWL